MSQKKWVIGNWKMNPASVDTVFEFCHAFANQLSADTAWQERVMVGIAPSFVHLGLVDYGLSQESLGDDGDLPIMLVSQDVAGFDKATGAFTGDVSAEQITDLAEWTLIGHSERRQYHHETNELLTQKIINANRANLGVILCIGETKTEYQGGQTLGVLDTQLSILQGLTVENLIIAYEPVWAIGTGLTPTLDEIDSTHAHIKQTVERIFGKPVPILYGGSVNAANADDIAGCVNVDGVLVGGASLQAESFVSIIKAFA